MRLSQSQIGKLVAGSLLLAGFSGVSAASLTNTVMVPGSMTWMQDLASVDSPTATDVVVMDNGDGTFTYMGTDNVAMDGGMTPLWDYSWNLTADADPLIGGSFTITNVTSMTQTFDLIFSVPVSPSFTNGFMTGSLSGSYVDADNSGGATLNLNSWDGLIDGTSQMNLFAFGGSCVGAGCSVTISEVSEGPTLYTGPVSSTIGIHMNFSLSAGDSATFNTQFEVNPVPVPAAVWLFGSGLLGLLGLARRKAA